MGNHLPERLLSHISYRRYDAGKEIFIKVDQTLTHDINAVMTYLAFEAIGLDRVRTECSVSYLDHNLLYVDNKTPDDHIYLQSAAKKFGVYVSRPATASAIPFMYPVLVCQARYRWAETVTHRMAARSVCCVSVSVAWM